MIAPLSISLPQGFGLLINSETDILKNSADDGRHANFINLVTVSHELVKDVTLSVEAWSDYNDDPTQRPKRTCRQSACEKASKSDPSTIR